MASQRVIAELKAKKHQVFRDRLGVQRNLSNVQSIYRHSRSALASADRKIEATRENLDESLLILNQNLSRKESLLRLVDAAKHRLVTEKETKEQTEQNIEFADDEDEKNSAQVYLRGVVERISEIESDIKNRQKAIRGLDSVLDSLTTGKDKTLVRIKKINQTKPELKKLLKTSQKDAEIIGTRLQRLVKQEQSAQKTLKKAQEGSKPAAKPKSTKRRSKPAKRSQTSKRPAKPTKRRLSKAKPAKRSVKTSKRPAKPTKRRLSKAKPAKRSVKTSKRPAKPTKRRSTPAKRSVKTRRSTKSKKR